MLKPYHSWAPSQYDTRGLGLDERQDWLVAPCSHNRDSEAWEESNWQVMCRDVQGADPAGDCEIHRFGHWACGWFEIMLVRPGSECAGVAERIQDSLENYPILDEDHMSELEHANDEDAD